MTSLAEEVEFGGRHPQDAGRWVIPLLAGCWSIFQLLVADLVLLDSLVVRCVHLAFALSLVYLSFTARKGHQKTSIPWWDWVLAIFGVAAALYLFLDYEGISERQGIPLIRDLVAGTLLIVVLLEGARRALGPALPIVALIFILSSLFASSLPRFIASKDVSISHLVGKLTMSTEGIYGIPLRVSSDTVFLFVLFGAMLEKAGGGQYFIDLAYALLGRFRGGPAKASVLASGLTGTVSGSSIANTVTTGTFTIPLMKKYGYPAEKAAAIEVAASTNGQLMPPVMGAAAFIIAEYCNIQYLAVVKAAIIPAVISYLTLIFITHLEAVKLGLKPLAKEQIPNFFKVFFRGLHFTLPLLFLVYQLVIMRRSAAAAAYTAVIVLAVVIVVRDLVLHFRAGDSWKKALRSAGTLIGESLVAGGRNMMVIGVAVSAAGIIVGVVSMGLGGKITEVVDVLSGGRLLPMLLITAVVSLILGMGLPTTANYIVMANLTAPVIVALGAQSGLEVPLIAAHLFVFYFGILADDTPPVGLAAYAASAIARSDPIRTGIQGFYYDLRTALLPFLFVFNTDLLLIGINSWGNGLLILATGTVAMFAVAAVLQRHLLTKTTWWEIIILVGSAAALFRPHWTGRFLAINAGWAYALGAALFAFVLLLQRLRMTRPLPG